MQDFIAASKERCDLFVKGSRLLSIPEQIQKLQEIYIVLAVPLANVFYSFEGESGAIELPQETYEPLYQLLSDYQPHSIKDVLFTLSSKFDREQLHKAIRTLISLNMVFIIRDPVQVNSDEKQHCLNFNQQILDNAIFGCECLLSPLTGCGVYVSSFNMALLRNFNQHLKGASTLDTLDLSKLTADMGQLINKESPESTTHEQQLNFLTDYVTKFKLNQLAIYKSLGLVQFEV